MEKAQLHKKGRRKYIMLALLAILLIFCTITAIQYRSDIRASYEKLNSYPVQSINTEFGKMSFMDTGTGDAVLLSHGIFGGYDQAYESLKGLVGKSCRKLTPSRFGYPGSDVPEEPTPEN
jgi:hypothetical protein